MSGIGPATLAATLAVMSVAPLALRLILRAASTLPLPVRPRLWGGPAVPAAAIELPALLGTALTLLASAPAAPADRLGGVLLFWGLLAAAWVDARAYRLPDRLTLPLLGLGLVLAALGDRLETALAGAALGWGGLAGAAFLYRRWRGRAGLGDGDARLLAVGGAWLGWAALPGLLVTASLLGLAWAILRAGGRDRRRRRLGHGPRPGLGLGSRLPLGPPLAAAIWLAWLAGPLLLAP